MRQPFACVDIQLEWKWMSNKKIVKKWPENLSLNFLPKDFQTWDFSGRESPVLLANWWQYSIYILLIKNNAIWMAYNIMFGRPFIKRFALCYQTIVCPLCLSVMLVYCGQTVGWIKMKLDTEVGLSPGHIGLEWDPAPLPKRGTAPNFWLMSVVTKQLDGLRCHLVRR